MAANLTLGSCAVAADGKTLTATISGGTGTGYAIVDATSLQPHISGLAQGFCLDIASVSVSVATLTINLTTPIGIGETWRLDLTTSATLSDSGGNTAQGQTNLAITNNSTVVVTNYTTTQLATLIEMNSYVRDGNGRLDWSDTWSSAGTPGGDWPLEFVTDATEICMFGLGSNSCKFRIDGATADSTARVGQGFWAAKPLQTSPLGAGKHLVLLGPGGSGSYFYGLRLSGGTRSFFGIPTTKTTAIANTGSALNLSASSLLTLWGAYKTQSATSGQISCGSFEGLEIDVKFTGTGLEVAAVVHANNSWAASVDGAAEGAVIVGGEAATSNVNGYIPLATGKTAAVQHTMKATMVGIAACTPFGVRVLNGTVLSSAASIADGTISVADTTNIAVLDWIRIDKWSKREWRQVTAISGSGPYTLTLNAALGKAHSSGEQVTSYSAAAGSLATWTAKDLSARRILAIGDSNTEAYNDYGAAATPDANGTYYTLYDPRPSPIFTDGQLLSWEVINCGIQGRTSANMSGDTANFNAFARNAFDFVTVWAGTNDINGGGVSPATYQTNVQAIVTAVLPNLRAGGRVILLPPGTPSTTSGAGLNLATCAAALQAIADANPTQVVYAAHLLDSTNAGDISGGLHWHVSGQVKIAANLMPYFVGLIMTDGFFAA
jgi:lysophospholipase L1-like esterase